MQQSTKRQTFINKTSISQTKKKMTEAELISEIDKIEEEIIKEDNGFVQKITSTEETVVEKIIKSSKEIEKKIQSLTQEDVQKEKEPMKSLFNLFLNNKGKISYNYDEFDNGTIRVFETTDENLTTEMHKIADALSRQVPSDIFLHENTVTSFILNSEKPVMIFFVYPEQEESNKLIEKIREYIINFEKVEVRAINVKESEEMDDIFKVGMETPIVVLYRLVDDQINETARLTAAQATPENIKKMAQL